MSEDIKMALWIDNNGHRTLDNFTKQEQAYYHASDVKTLREVTCTLTNQVKVLKEALGDLMASVGGGEKDCGHNFTCICAEDKALEALKVVE